jgi:hypothetical protein
MDTESSSLLDDWATGSAFHFLAVLGFNFKMRLRLTVRCQTVGSLLSLVLSPMFLRTWHDFTKRDAF